MVYLSPGRSNLGPENLDGYGISYIAFGVIYSIILYAACIYLWLQRHHPVVKMRKVSLMLLSVLVIHVFCFLVLSVYTTISGSWPCSVEYWAMNLYLPIGIGLWQAQNQQLLIVSRQQTQLIVAHKTYKPLLPSHGLSTPRNWLWRFKLWYRNVSTQGKYEGFVLIGIIIQVTPSILRKSLKEILTMTAVVYGFDGCLQYFSQIQRLRRCVTSHLTGHVPPWMGVVRHI